MKNIEKNQDALKRTLKRTDSEDVDSDDPSCTAPKVRLPYLLAAYWNSAMECMVF